MIGVILDLPKLMPEKYISLMHSMKMEIYAELKFA